MGGVPEQAAKMNSGLHRFGLARVDIPVLHELRLACDAVVTDGVPLADVRPRAGLSGSPLRQSRPLEMPPQSSSRGSA
jgi:hypothetical protein